MLSFLLTILLSANTVKLHPHTVKVKLTTENAVSVVVEIKDASGEFNYYRSSGFTNPRHTEWLEFRDVPTGEYEVIAIERGADGKEHASNVETLFIQ